MSYTTENTAMQHFSGSGTDHVIFWRPPHTLILTVEGEMEVSFDGGTNYMTFLTGTYTIDRIAITHLYFQGANDWSGVGVAL